MEYYRSKIYANAAWSAGIGWLSQWDASSTPVEELTDLTYLAMFAPPGVVARVKSAHEEGYTVEMEYTSFNDPGPDECA